jgi:hypothetical protein
VGAGVALDFMIVGGAGGMAYMGTFEGAVVSGGLMGMSSDLISQRSQMMAGARNEFSWGEFAASGPLGAAGGAVGFGLGKYVVAPVARAGGRAAAWFGGRIGVGAGIGGEMAGAVEAGACTGEAVGSAMPPRVVIGETMGRVRTAASELGASTFELTEAQQAWRQAFLEAGASPKGMDELLGAWNRAWMEENAAAGARFLDIGIDMSRNTPSWYSNERAWARELNIHLEPVPGWYVSPSIRIPAIPAGN